MSGDAVLERLEEMLAVDATETATVTVDRVTGDIATVTTADGRSLRLPASEHYPDRTLTAGDRFAVAVVSRPGGEPYASTTHPDLVRLLLAGQAPELRDGRVRIVDIARRAGVRSKVAVAATVEGVDPVGACLGHAAARTRAVGRQLGGERIDIVAHHSDVGQYAANALAVRAESWEDDGDTLTLAVGAHQIEAAHGGGNVNVALVAELIERRIRIVPANPR